MATSKMGWWVLLGAIIIVVAVYWLRMSHSTGSAPVTSSVPTVTALPPTDTPVMASPTAQPTMVGWKTVTDSASGVTLQYPPSLGTTYITTAPDWPPKVQVINQAFSCTPAGSPIGKGGQTMKATVNGHDYCVTQASEGAAGSIYTTYTYAWASGAKTVSLSFTLRMVQCANYDNPQKTACMQEQTSFDVGTIADGIAQSVKLP